MKFDYILGNPPYQDDTIGDNKGYAPPLYHYMLDGAYELSDHVMMIHPARFLYNAGSTPKAWNQKMLSDPHLKVIWHEQDSSKVFSGTDIKGGVAVTYHDANREYGAIGTYTQFDELNGIIEKVIHNPGFRPLTDIMVSSYSYHFTEQLHKDHPDAASRLSEGHAYDLKSNVFTRLPDIFLDTKPDDGYDYVQIYGRDDNARAYKYIRADYIEEVPNLYKWKIFVPKANGSGALGEVMTTPVIGQPVIGHTESFVSIGLCDTRSEAEAILKYVKSKFARCMLGVLKVTQDNPPEKWAYVPLQDFTPASDIDWSASIPEIDAALYRKYDLDQGEIDFIESHVKPMA